MKRKFAIMLFALCCMLSLATAQNMRSLFLTAPDQLLPLLPYNSRADLVDYAEANMTAKVTNLLGGVSTLLELKSDFLLLEATASSTVQMKLLPFGNENIVCVVKSVKAEAEDSRVYFYDSSWNRLSTDSFFTMPEIREFFLLVDTIDRYLDMCDIYLVSLKLNAGNNTLTAEYTMPNYMSEESAAAVGPLLRKRVYNWENGRFVLVEE